MDLWKDRAAFFALGMAVMSFVAAMVIECGK